MANVLTANPMVITTAVSSISAFDLRLIQWMDDGTLVDTDDMVLVLNGATLTMKLQLTNGEKVCVWEAGPFNPPIPVSGLTVTTLDHGALHVWVGAKYT